MQCCVLLGDVWTKMNIFSHPGKKLASNMCFALTICAKNLYDVNKKIANLSSSMEFVTSNHYHFPTVRTEPPPPIGCTSNEQCPQDKMCDTDLRSCVPPCDYDPCAKYATCINSDHKAICNCIAGYTGDPYQKDDCG